jgi:flagellar biosynthesis/type III secretory pathway M-ring protein FliF/YscJ
VKYPTRAREGGIKGTKTGLTSRSRGMAWIQLGLDIVILFLMAVLLFELRRARRSSFEETLERALVQPEGPQSLKRQPTPGAQGELAVPPGEDQGVHESAYERVVELLREGYSVEKILKEVTQIPEQEVRLIAQLKRPRRST